METLGRRSFLVGVAGAATLASCRTPVAPAPPSSDAWEGIRAQFSLAKDHIHLAALLLVSHPKPVREAIERHRRALDENPVEHMHEHEGTWRMHETAAAYMGCKREEIALTDSTTMGIGAVCGGLRFSAGDELLVSTHDHYSLHEALRLAGHRTGAVVRKTAMYDDPASATDAGMLDVVAKAMSAKTRLIAMTWVHSSSGVKIPMRAIADMVADANAKRPPEERALLFVDGVHGFGVETEDIPGLGCDIFVSGCHKWIFGPRGTGVIWSRPEAWTRMQPTIPGFAAGPFEAWKSGTTPPPTNAFMMTPGGYHTFEHRWALPEAFEFHLAIGKAKIKERTHALNHRLKDGLRAMKHVTLRTPMDEARCAGIVCFDVAGLKPDEVVDRLKAKKIVISSTANTPSYARMSAAIFNPEYEIDQALHAVRGLA